MAGRYRVPMAASQIVEPPKSEPRKTPEGSFRWWEFYAVRYAMGTIVGAAVFYVLCSGTQI